MGRFSFTLRIYAQKILSAVELKVGLSLPVSVLTAQRILDDEDWICNPRWRANFGRIYVCAQSWAKDILLRGSAVLFWDFILFSKEKQWNLDRSDGFQHYWRCNGVTQRVGLHHLCGLHNMCGYTRDEVY